MNPTSVTVGVPVADLDASIAWYRFALGLGEPDLVPVVGIVEWVFGPIFLQLFLAPEDVGRDGIALTISVADVHATRGQLVAQDLTVSDVERVEGVVDLFFLTDPDRNTLCFITELGPRGR